MAYEGEIAVIIGRRARHVTIEQAAEHIGWLAPANDVGVHDFRWADRGSGVLAKGHDGFTPIGLPMPADGVQAESLRLTTTVNGELRQDATGEDLIFSFEQLVADLSRFMTLEPGDVILTGTPAGTGLIGPGDVVEVTLARRRGSAGDEHGRRNGFGARALWRDAEGDRRGARGRDRRPLWRRPGRALPAGRRARQGCRTTLERCSRACRPRR